ncbi:MAG TPA: hypothetical protein DDY37_04900, partial [Legionella sp.]|nr:hypothetical protein [Legionella sp.]
ERAISKTIQKLSMTFEASSPDRLFEEIEHVLLDLNQFKGCGKDFHHKLNSIRLVVQRGDWRTPRGMILENNNSKETKLNELSMKLSQAHADLRHFKGLQAISQGELRQRYEGIIETTLCEVKKLEQALEQQKSDVVVAM